MDTNLERMGVYSLVVNIGLVVLKLGLAVLSGSLDTDTPSQARRHGNADRPYFLSHSFPPPKREEPRQSALFAWAPIRNPIK